MDSDNIYICLMGLLVAIIIAICLLQPYFEMKAFNRFSNKKATYIDAMFSNLRIITKGDL